ncbi:MAG: sialidase family protein [Fibrobacterota bacterium]
MIFTAKKAVLSYLIVFGMALCTIISADQADVITVEENREGSFAGLFGGQLDNRGLATTPDGKLLSIDLRVGRYYATCSQDYGTTWAGLNGDSTCTYVTSAGSFCNNALYHYLGADGKGNGYIVTICHCKGGVGWDAIPGTEVNFIKITPNGNGWEYSNSILLDTRLMHCLTSGSILEDGTGRLWAAYNYTDGTTMDIKAFYSDDQGDTWDSSGRITTVTLPGTWQETRFHSTLVPYQGYLACIYRADADLYWTYYDGSQWVTSMRIPFNSSYNSAYPFGVTTSANHIFIPFVDDGGSFRVIQWDGSTWNDRGTFVSLPRLVACGNTVVAFYADGNELYYKKYTDNAWTGPVLIATETDSIKTIVTPQISSTDYAYAMYTNSIKYTQTTGYVKLARIALQGTSLQSPAPSGKVGPLHLTVSPNPLNSTVSFQYLLRRAGRIKCDIYSPLGEKMKTLLHENQDHGCHRIRWDGKSDKGVEVPPGVYFVRLLADGQQAIKSVFVIK